MANKTLRSRPGSKTRATPIRLAEWLDALDLAATKVAAEGDLNEGYLSELVNGRKKNPGMVVLFKLANGIGKLINCDFQPQLLLEYPPKGDAAYDEGKYGLKLIARLAKARRKGGA